MTKHRASILAAAAVLAGTTFTIVQTGQADAIVGGEPLLVDGVNPQPAVVQIFSDNGLRDIDGLNCTGTLISPTWVLSAAHCMIAEAPRTEPFSPSEVKVSFRKGPRNPAYSVRPYQIFLMPGYTDKNAGGDDVAVLHLREPITDVDPLPLLYGPQAGTVDLVERYGYGAIDPDQRSGRATELVKRSLEQKVPLERFAGGLPGTFRPDNLLVTEAVTGGTAGGDSGGPVLAQLITGGYAVTGVTFGSIDATGEHSGDPFKDGVFGLSNRVDTDSPAWSFIGTHVSDVRYAG